MMQSYIYATYRLHQVGLFVCLNLEEKLIQRWKNTTRNLVYLLVYLNY